MRALISVSDKTGIVALAQELSDLGVEIISTGGTAALLQKEGVAVRSVSEVTGFPEILGGRVKTLHPVVHGGILAVRSEPEHMRQLVEHGIIPVDLVIVNLYPFKQTISRPGVSLAEAIENIDIGGPTMIRSAAKNFASVAVVVNPERYGEISEALKKDGRIPDDLRFGLAVEAFQHTAAYDAVISRYLWDRKPERENFPRTLTLTYDKVQDLHYGENPHQRAAFYREPFPPAACIAGVEQLHGREMSFNNVNDTNAALELVKEFTGPAAVAVKHTNPCGVGTGDTIAAAYRSAYEADPVSIFGGIIALNRPVDGETAAEIAKIFVEVVIAPGFLPEALDILTKKKNLRLLQTGEMTGTRTPDDIKRVSGGILLQDADTADLEPAALKTVTERAPTAAEMADLLFAWKVVKNTKSNAIVLAREGRTVGVGAGQMNRVGAAKIAAEQAGDKAKGAVLASDAFFPFPDTVEEAAKAGVTAIIQPGGSVKDQDSIAAANAHGIAMVFTGIRHFKH